MNDKFTILLDTMKNMTLKFDSMTSELDRRGIIDDAGGRDRILQWLDPVYTYDEKERALFGRVEGTCDWIMEKEVFRHWLDAESSSIAAKILWIHGCPGSGKTVMAARLTQYLENIMLVTSFFCFHSDECKRQPISILRSWIAQLVLLSPDALGIVGDFYASKRLPNATELDLWSMFKRLCLGLQDTTFILDGFDECTRNESASRSHTPLNVRQRFLKGLEESIEGSSVKVLITSRETAELRGNFQRNLQDGSSTVTWLQYEILREDTSKDILSYANATVELTLSKKPGGLKMDIASRLASKSDGMFLYIHRLQPRLKSTYGASKLKDIIEKMPSGLDEAYERDLTNIMQLDSDDRDRALAILRWVLFAQRPLSLREISEALLINVDEDKPLEAAFPREDLPDDMNEDYVNEQITGLCGSFLELRSAKSQRFFGDQTIHFAHYTIKEYLSQVTSKSIPTLIRSELSDGYSAHEVLTAACLKYLCYTDFIQTQWSDKEQYDAKLKGFAFLQYAAVAWCYHKDCLTLLSPRIHQLCKELLDPQNSRWMSYCEIIESHANNSFEKFKALYTDHYPNPLQYAALHGLTSTINHLINKGAEVNQLGGEFSSPLTAAAARGYTEVVSQLLEQGAEVNLVDYNRNWGNALHAAASMGHEEVLNMLLDHDADVNLEGGFLRYAIVAASLDRGIGDRELQSFRMVENLLQAGAWIDVSNHEGVGPLHLAARNGATRLVGLLLEAGADVNARTMNGGTPLHYAAASENQDINHVIYTLLEHGGDLKREDVSMRSPLHVACKYGQESAARELLEWGADIDAIDVHGRTALHYVSAMGHQAIAKHLLEHGAKLSSPDYTGQAPLQCAARFGHRLLVQELLNHGADIEAHEAEKPSPLYQAAENGHLETVEALLANHPCMESGDDREWTSLHVAVSNGHDVVMRALLEGGSDREARTNHLETPLHLAISNYELSMIDTLIEYGADIEASDVIGCTPLILASNDRSEELVKILLGHGAVPTSADIDGVSSLHWAASNKDTAIAGQLLDAGCPVDIRDGERRTPLARAIFIWGEELAKTNGHLDMEESHDETSRVGYGGIVRLLLRNGADPNTLDIYGCSCYDRIEAGRWKNEFRSYLPQATAFVQISSVIDARKDGALSVIHGILEMDGSDSMPSTLIPEGKVDLYNRLKRIFLLQGKFEDASTGMSYRNRRESLLSEDQIVRLNNVVCDGCELPGQEKGRCHSRHFSCCTCIDVDLCPPCMDQYIANGRSLEMIGYESCEAHDYFEIIPEPWGWEANEKINSRGETEREWLNRLIREYNACDESK